MLDSEEEKGLLGTEICKDGLDWRSVTFRKARLRSRFKSLAERVEHIWKCSAPWSPIATDSHTFNPSLEGLRGIAILLTLICHILEGHYNFREAAGTLGVAIFFCLSGFLITAVLIRLQCNRKSTSAYLVRFYSDRFVRLSPGLFIAVASIWYLHKVRGDDMIYVNHFALLALFYMTNIRDLRTPKDDLGPFGNTWSLACEEQFYIMWAIVLPFILARGTRMRAILMVAMIGVLLFIRIYASMYPGAIFDIDWRGGVWANVWKMLIGATLRLVPIPSLLTTRPFAYIGVVGLSALLYAAQLPQPSYETIAPGWANHTFAIMTWIDVLGTIFTSLILCGVSGDQGGIKILEIMPIRFIGRISYSLYLWQAPLIALNGWKRDYPALGDTAIAFVLAMFSTICIEEPIMRLYKKWKAKKDHNILPLESST